MMLPRGDVIRDYVSFAASVASLVLALVAIWQSFRSSEELGKTVGALSTSANDMRLAALEITDVTKSLVITSQELTGQLNYLPPAVQAIADKIDRLSPDKDAQPTIITDEPTSPEEFVLPKGKELSIGAIIGTYVLATSSVTGREINVPEALGGNSLAHYVNGFINAVYLFEPLGIKVARIGSAAYKTESVDLNLRDRLFSYMAKSTSSVPSKYKGKLDAYLKSEKLPEETKEDNQDR